MYIHSLLTLVNIADAYTPTIGVGADALHMYADDGRLFTAHEGSITEQIVGIKPSYLENHGIV